MRAEKKGVADSQGKICYWLIFFIFVTVTIERERDKSEKKGMGMQENK